jgi:hypothetical protein
MIDEHFNDQIDKEQIERLQIQLKEEEKQVEKNVRQAEEAERHTDQWIEQNRGKFPNNSK